MSYKINRYSDKKDFIVEFNHNQGLQILDGAELVDGVYTEFTYALQPYEIMHTEQAEIDVQDYDEQGEVIGTHKETVTLNYPIVNPNYEEEQKQKEKARIQELFMTRSDFFDGTIMAWGVDEDSLLPLIITMVNAMPLDDKLKLKALNNFKNALNFYRKHDLFKMLINIPIQLTETIQVILTDEALDKFFDEVAKGNKDTAWQYLPQPVQIPLPEEPVEEVEDENTTNTTI